MKRLFLLAPLLFSLCAPVPAFADSEFEGADRTGWAPRAPVCQLSKMVTVVVNQTSLLTNPGGRKWLCASIADSTAGEALFSMRPGDYIARTFASTAVTVNAPPTQDTITATAHGYTTGDGPYKMTTTTTLPGGIVAGTLFYVRVVDANTLALHTTNAGALDGTSAPLDITSQGAGNHTIGGMPSAVLAATDGYAATGFVLNSNTIVTTQLYVFPAPDEVTVTVPVSTAVAFWWLP